MKTPQEIAKAIHQWLSFSSDPEEDEIKKLATMIQDIITIEREACAMVCDQYIGGDDELSHRARLLAALIRGRALRGQP